MPIGPSNNNPINPLFLPQSGQNYQNTPQPQQINTNPQNDSNEQNTPVASEIYRAQNGIITPLQYQFSVSHANNDEATMHEIYEIDKEAFADTDPYENYEHFLNIVSNNNLSTYAVKDNDGNLIGYYQLEPIKDNDLYIDSIGIKPEFRMTRKGANAIKYAWKEIQKFAHENNVQTLSLHVDAENRALVRMYQNLGFSVSETLNNYYENGSNAYFMTMQVPATPEQQTVNPTQETENTEEIQEETAEPEIPQEPELSEKERAEIALNERMQQAREELLSLGNSEETVNWVLPNCIVKDGKFEVFNEDLFECCKFITNHNKFPIKNNFNKAAYKNLINGLIENKGRTGIEVRTDLLPEIAELARRECSIFEIDRILETAKTTKNNWEYISKDALELGAFLATKTDNKYNIYDVIEACKIETETGKKFDKNAIERARKILIWDEEKYSSLEDLLIASKVEDENGYTSFSDEVCSAILKDIKEYSFDKGVFCTAYGAKTAKNAGCDIIAYIKYGPLIKNNNFWYKIPENRKPDYKNHDIFLYNVFKACCEKKTLPTWNGTTTKIDFNHNTFNLIKELCWEEETPKFKDLKNIPKLIEACKTAEFSAYPDLSFNKKVFDKAMQYIQAGGNEETAASVINACILKTYNTHTGKLQESVFNNDIFNIFMTRLNNNEFHGPGVDTIKACTDMVNGKEVFRPERYEQLKHTFVYFNNNSFSSADAGAFFREDDKFNRTFDSDLYIKCNDANVLLELICESAYGKDSITRYYPKEFMLNAYKELNSREIPFTKRSFDYNMKKSPQYYLMKACMDNYGFCNSKFNKETYNNILKLLDRGFDGRDIYEFICNCQEAESYDNKNFYFNDIKFEDVTYTEIFKPERYKTAMDLMEQGMDINTAGYAVSNFVKNGTVDTESIQKTLELYKLGIESPVNSVLNTQNSDLGFQRAKDCHEMNLPQELINNCKDKDEFKESLFIKALSLREKGYTPDTINKLMGVCHTQTEKNSKITKAFCYEMYDTIEKMEKLGINKEAMVEILKACKNKGDKYCPEAFEKVATLHYKGIDDEGIKTFLSRSFEKTDNYDTKFSQEKFEKLSNLTANINILRDHTHKDSYIIEKLSSYSDEINSVTKTFGEDVMKNVLTSRIDGYIKFVEQCSEIQNKCSEEFVNELNERLNTLPSPELKVKRLRVIGGLADKVDEKALENLSNMIKSPEMSPSQIKLANEIFTDKDKDYETKIEKFIEQFHVPQKSKQIVREYLLNEKLDTKINYPKTIEEQMTQMDEYAQQMLINPKIPLDKKIKYIDEFKIKKADMQANPEKYTTPEILAKPLTELKKMVMAHINIPNDDAKFCQSLVTAMYTRCGIEANEDLLRAIRFDSKYFDKLFATTYDFNENFRKLIELKRSNTQKPLMELRIELPQEGSALYEKFDRIGLIKQIQANLDTKRQYEEQGLNFDKWNSFDSDLKSESFTVEANPEIEFENIKFNLINIFQDENFDKINTEETQKLTQYLSQYGFMIYSNNLYKNGQPAQKNDIERFAEITKEYIEKNDYWKSTAENGNIQLPEDETIGINGFKDHLKGILHHIEEIKGAKTVHNINFRLSDSNNIGRNIFFGNHVGCCNSAESTYAGYSAPMHLLNAYNRGIELVDKFGNSYGNSNCFFAIIDNKLTFVIDSFEANGDLASNPIVTDKLVEFGKQVCEEMGRSDAQVMIGPSFNHINQSRLKQIPVNNIKVVGTVSVPTYCDSVGGLKVMDNINKGVSNKRMFIYQ